jgi:hypothetical protein
MKVAAEARIPVILIIAFACALAALGMAMGLYERCWNLHEKLLAEYGQAYAAAFDKEVQEVGLNQLVKTNWRVLERAFPSKRR